MKLYKSCIYCTLFKHIYIYIFNFYRVLVYVYCVGSLDLMLSFPCKALIQGDLEKFCDWKKGILYMSRLWGSFKTEGGGNFSVFVLHMLLSSLLNFYITYLQLLHYQWMVSNSMCLLPISMFHLYHGHSGQ